MPNVLVETRGGWLGAKRTALLDAIQAATEEALRIVQDGRGGQFDPFLVPHFVAMIRDDMI